jgi:maltose alpha-D-glucosyltransferase/alpha-amylase
MKINLGIRRRLAPLLGNNRRKIELMNILLFSFPGTPVIYYGDEIGMGDNYYLGDRDGVRTPMQWSTDRNAGFSATNPQRLYLPVITDPAYHSGAVNVESQQENLSSMLWWMKRVVAMRKRFVAFSRGAFEIIPNDNPRVVSFIRKHDDEVILVVANLSRFSQPVSLSIQQFAGLVPQELFSGNDFPPIRKRPYILTMVSHAHFWFLLRKRKRRVSQYENGEMPMIEISENYSDILMSASGQKRIEEVIPQYVRHCRWFGSKSRKIRRLTIAERIPLGTGFSRCTVLLLSVEYTAGDRETYVLPVATAYGSDAERIKEEYANTVIADVQTGDAAGIVFDATADKNFHHLILSIMAESKKVKIESGLLGGKHRKGLQKTLREAVDYDSQLLRAEQSNTSIRFGDTLFLKLYRKLESGTNPEVEIVRFLSERTSFRQIPPYIGAIEYQAQNAEPVSVGFLQGFIPNNGDGWEYTVDIARRYIENILSKHERLDIDSIQFDSLYNDGFDAIPEPMRELVDGTFFEMVSKLGVRTAQMHRALGSGSTESGFEAEPLSVLYQRSLFQSMQGLVRKTVQTLQSQIRSLPQSIRSEAGEIVETREQIVALLKKITRKKMEGKKIRIHGDYHLGQVLRTGNDFIIMDFEGEPARTLSERKLKYPAFKDVAGMMRSFHYAGYAAMLLNNRYSQQEIESLDPWILPWYQMTAGLFLHAYLQSMDGSVIIPADTSERLLLLDSFLLEKSVYELGYELNNRPEWIMIPIKSIKTIVTNERSM